jgi:hypothetical protein
MTPTTSNIARQNGLNGQRLGKNIGFFGEREERRPSAVELATHTLDLAIDAEIRSLIVEWYDDFEGDNKPVRATMRRRNDEFVLDSIKAGNGTELFRQKKDFELELIASRSFRAHSAVHEIYDRYEMNLGETVDETLARVDDGLKSVSTRRMQDVNLEFELGMQAVSAIIKGWPRTKTGAQVELADVSDDWEPTILHVTAISDERGKLLWTFDESDDESLSFHAHLSQYSPLLDFGGVFEMDKLPLRSGETEEDRRTGVEI